MTGRVKQSACTVGAIVLTAGLGFAMENAPIPSGSPSRWEIHSQEGQEIFTMFVAADRSVKATIGDRQWAGTFSGRVLELRSAAESDHDLRLRGWMTTPRNPDETAFLAGSLGRLSANGQVETSGWYALLIGEQPGHTDVEGRASLPSATDEGGGGSPTNSFLPPEVPSKGVFDGRWSGISGIFDIATDGNKMTVRTPQGTVVEGRITGPSQCVIGLRPGCCSGRLEDTDTLRLQDGTTLRREPGN